MRYPFEYIRSTFKRVEAQFNLKEAKLHETTGGKLLEHIHMHGNGRLIDQCCGPSIITRRSEGMNLGNGNRPVRAPDVELRQMMNATFAARPLHRLPPITVVADAMDQLLPNWPFPEHLPPTEAKTTIAAASAVICADLYCREAIPVVSEGHVWNLEQLTAAIAHSASGALSTQPNRRRTTGIDASRSLSKELSRGASGIWDAGRLVAGKLFGRWSGIRYAN